MVSFSYGAYEDLAVLWWGSVNGTLRRPQPILRDDENGDRVGLLIQAINPVCQSRMLIGVRGPLPEGCGRSQRLRNTQRNADGEHLHPLGRRSVS
jgi:hypothetical protein